MAKVRRSSTKNYKSIIGSKGYIPNHKYDVNDVFELAFQKQYVDNDGEVGFGFPSWHFFELLTGVQPQILEIDLSGEWDYDPKEKFENNLKKYLSEAIAEGKDVVTEAFRKAGITDEAIKSFVTGSPNDVWTERYEDLKMNFIEKNTDIVIDYGTTLSAKDPYKEKVFASGTIPPEEEDPKIYSVYNSMSFLARAIIDELFKKEHPQYDRKTEAGKAKYKDFYGEHSPIYNPSDEAVTYVVETKIDRAGKPVSSGPSTRLAYYDLKRGKTRIENIQSPIRASANVDRELDYVLLMIAYNNGDTKMDVGRNAKPTMATSCNVDPTIIFDRFSRTINDNCFAQCSKFKDANLSDIDNIVRDWLLRYSDIIKEFPIETLNQYQEVFKHLGLKEFVVDSGVNFVDASAKDEEVPKKEEPVKEVEENKVEEVTPADVNLDDLLGV